MFGATSIPTCLRTAPGFPRRFREALGGARSEGYGAVRKHGRSEKGSCFVHEDSRDLAILRSGIRRRILASVRARREGAVAHVPVSQTATGRFSLLERLRFARQKRQSRPRRAFRRHRGRRCSPALGEGKKRRLLLPKPRPASFGH